MISLRSRLACAVASLSLLACSAHAAGGAGSCRYVPVAKVPIEFSDRDMKPVIEGSIDGNRVPMYVDTGADTSYLMRSAVEQLHIPIDQSGQYVLGVGGASVVYAARLNDFSIGPAHLGKTTLPVIGQSHVPAAVAGLVGADFLLQTDLEIAIAARYIQFLQATGCDDTFLAYWDKEAMEVPFTGLQENSRKPMFQVELNGVKLLAMLDTGAAGTVVTRQGATLAGVKLDAPGVVKNGSVAGIGAAKLGSWQVTFDSFALGSETIQNAELTVVEDSPTGRSDRIDVVLGADFLRAHRVLVAMSQQRLYVSYVGGSVFAQPGETGK